MRNRAAHLIALTIGLLVAAAGCSNTAPGRPGQSTATSDPAGLSTAQRQWVDDTLARLTIREMAGQVVVAWIPGDYISTDSAAFDDAMRLVDAGIGTFWMMGGLPHSRAAKLNALQRHARVPILALGGGLGVQLFAAPRDTWMLGGGTDVPPPMAYAAIGDPDVVREAARTVATEARATGSHLMDDGGGANVLTNLRNVLHNRTYGDNPEVVSALTAAYVEGIHAGGALNYVGFFPGAGSLGADPHVELPVSLHDRQTFESVDLAPFRSAIAAGVDVVMTSHFAVPAITGSDVLPATLSPDVIRILREQLGFEGPVLTDDLSMGAIANTYDNIEAAISAFQAGHDMIMGVREFEVIDRLTQLVEDGEISRQRLETSVRRILELKARLDLPDSNAVSLDAVDTLVGQRAHQQAADDAAARSIVLLRDRDDQVPLRDSATTRVLSVVLEREDNEVAGAAFDGELFEALGDVSAVRLTPDSGPDDYARVIERARSADRVVFSIYLRPQLYADAVELPNAFVATVERLQQEEHDLVFVSFGKLTILDRLPAIGTLMMAWSEQPVMQRAAARALLGLAPISGTLPLSLPPHHHTGEGLVRASLDRE